MGEGPSAGPGRRGGRGGRLDARKEFAEEFCVPAIKANAKYENKYPLVSALSRPLIVRHLVAEARKHGADTVAHGCTGQGQRPGPLRGRDTLARPPTSTCWRRPGCGG